MPNKQQWHLVAVTYLDRTEQGKPNMQDVWNVYETPQEAKAAYDAAIEAGAYTASICRVIESTDYF